MRRKRGKERMITFDSNSFSPLPPQPTSPVSETKPCLCLLPYGGWKDVHVHPPPTPALEWTGPERSENLYEVAFE